MDEKDDKEIAATKALLQISMTDQIGLPDHNWDNTIDSKKYVKRTSQISVQQFIHRSPQKSKSYSRKISPSSYYFLPLITKSFNLQHIVKQKPISLKKTPKRQFANRHSLMENKQQMNFDQIKQLIRQEELKLIVPKESQNLYGNFKKPSTQQRNREQLAFMKYENTTRAMSLEGIENLSDTFYVQRANQVNLYIDVRQSNAPK